MLLANLISVKDAPRTSAFKSLYFQFPGTYVLSSAGSFPFNSYATVLYLKTLRKETMDVFSKNPPEEERFCLPAQFFFRPSILSSLLKETLEKAPKI